MAETHNPVIHLLHRVVKHELLLLENIQGGQVEPDEPHGQSITFSPEAFQIVDVPLDAAKLLADGDPKLVHGTILSLRHGAYVLWKKSIMVSSFLRGPLRRWKSSGYLMLDGEQVSLRMVIPAFSSSSVPSVLSPCLGGASFAPIFQAVSRSIGQELSIQAFPAPDKGAVSERRLLVEGREAEEVYYSSNRHYYVIKFQLFFRRYVDFSSVCCGFSGGNVDLFSPKSYQLYSRF